VIGPCTTRFDLNGAAAGYPLRTTSRSATRRNSRSRPAPGPGSDDRRSGPPELHVSRTCDATGTRAPAQTPRCWPRLHAARNRFVWVLPARDISAGLRLERRWCLRIRTAVPASPAARSVLEAANQRTRRAVTRSWQPWPHSRRDQAGRPDRRVRAQIAYFGRDGTRSGSAAIKHRSASSGRRLRKSATLGARSCTHHWIGLDGQRVPG
jgi:hypothetical protein